MIMKPLGQPSQLGLSSFSQEGCGITEIARPDSKADSPDALRGVRADLSERVSIPSNHQQINVVVDPAPGRAASNPVALSYCTNESGSIESVVSATPGESVAIRVPTDAAGIKLHATGKYLLAADIECSLPIAKTIRLPARWGGLVEVQTEPVQELGGALWIELLDNSGNQVETVVTDQESAVTLGPLEAGVYVLSVFKSDCRDGADEELMVSESNAIFSTSLRVNMGETSIIEVGGDLNDQGQDGVRVSGEVLLAGSVGSGIQITLSSLASPSPQVVATALTDYSGGFSTRVPDPSDYLCYLSNAGRVYTRRILDPPRCRFVLD